MVNVTAAILAGGLGTRLRSVVKDRPKVLAEIGGRPFLAYLLDQLAVVKVKSIVLCTGYRGEQVQEMFGDSYAGVGLVYSRESSPLGTAGALRLALPLFEFDSILVMNGDSFFGMDLSAFWEWHRAHSASGTLSLVEVADTTRYGRVHVDSGGAVVRFEEKSDTGMPGCINAGVYLLARHLLLTIPTNRPVSLERDMFPSWVGKRLYGYKCEGCFLDIGTPEAYAVAERFFAAEPSANNRVAHKMGDNQ